MASSGEEKFKQEAKASLAVMDKPKGIAAKMVAAMAEIDAITKEGRNTAQSYNYVRAADVANEVRKALIKNKIGFLYDVEKEERWTTDRIDRNSGSVIGQMNYVSLHVQFSFVDSEGGESSVMTVRGIGWGSDVGDKAIYKAMTGALKYALRMNFIIPDESDPENDSKDEKSDEVQESPREAAQRRAAEAANKLAEQQGIFSLTGDRLTCVIKSAQEKKDRNSKPYTVFTFNGRLPNSANFASCFHTNTAETLRKSIGKEVSLLIKTNGQYANIEGLAPEDVSQEPPVEAYSGDY